MVKSILYIHSLETFIYSKIIEAHRNHDQTKIETLGPFAFILSEILMWAENNNGRE